MIETAPRAVSADAVTAALRQVRDPELDESIVDLEFVESVQVEGGDSVQITLRLPTFWCAPNFSYLMAHDAREAALGVPGVRDVRIVLKDNAYSDEITLGVTQGKPFDQVFTGQAESEDLDQLRQLFRNKAFGMRQEQLLRFLLEQGCTPREIVALRIVDVLDASDATGLRLRVSGSERLLRGGAPLARAFLERRPNFESDRLVTNPSGRPIPAHELDAYLQDGRRQRISITFNTMMCRGLLETRYGLERREGL